MKLFSYVLALDYGFAPNPFFGICTLATCKPQIRKAAKVGDWVVGTGSKTENLDGHVVYIMRVTEILSFDHYWVDPRFKCKRPNLRASLMHAYGDNIYHHAPNTRTWVQAYSHHSHEDGSLNVKNVKRDTGSTTNVLASSDFAYWGGDGPKIPSKFRNFGGEDICIQRRGYKCHFPDGLVVEFVNWIGSLDARGYCGAPGKWKVKARAS